MPTALFKISLCCVVDKARCTNHSIDLLHRQAFIQFDEGELLLNNMHCFISSVWVHPTIPKVLLLIYDQSGWFSVAFAVGGFLKTLSRHAFTNLSQNSADS
jgi:hypothetical protein